MYSGLFRSTVSSSKRCFQVIKDIVEISKYFRLQIQLLYNIQHINSKHVGNVVRIDFLYT